VRPPRPPRRPGARPLHPRPLSHPPPSAAAPQATQTRREAVGVELYGYQQTLAKLQAALQKAQEGCGVVNGARCAAVWGRCRWRRRTRSPAPTPPRARSAPPQLPRQQLEKDLQAARRQLDAAAAAAGDGRAQAERHQRELDRLGATLKQVEEHSQKVGGRGRGAGGVPGRRSGGGQPRAWQQRKAGARRGAAGSDPPLRPRRAPAAPPRAPPRRHRSWARSQ
jgi:hypothetical protein